MLVLVLVAVQFKSVLQSPSIWFCQIYDSTNILQCCVSSSTGTFGSPGSSGSSMSKTGTMSFQQQSNSGTASGGQSCSTPSGSGTCMSTSGSCSGRFVAGACPSDSSSGVCLAPIRVILDKPLLRPLVLCLYQHGQLWQSYCFCWLFGTVFRYHLHGRILWHIERLWYLYEYFWQLQRNVCFWRLPWR